MPHVSFTHDLRPFIALVRQSLAAHALEKPGHYRRWLKQNPAGTRQLDLDLYGTADAVHLLYTLNELPKERAAREALVSSLQHFQDPATGLFPNRDGLSPIHSTAFCLGALELLDAGALHEQRDLLRYASREGLHGLLDGLDWVNQPWRESHQGAGIYAALVLSGAGDATWEDHYFNWLWENQDAETGLWRADCILDVEGKLRGAPLFHHLASSFHYLFNSDYARRPVRYAEALADTCIRMRHQGHTPDFGSQGLSWNEIDWLYTLRSLQKRSRYRSGELRELIRETSAKLIAAVLDIRADNEGLNDLHTLFAGLSALAVIQEALPGYIRTDKPLRLVLDRRPFL